MNMLARLLEFHTPDLVKERILDELFAATAAGFGREVPAVKLSYDERLAAYARFTRDEAERAIREGRDLAEIEIRLRREAFALGRRLRGILGVDGTAEALTVARPLYRAIGIDFRGAPSGPAGHLPPPGGVSPDCEVTVRRCFFSDYYTPEICALISALDEGVLAGLAGGGRLVFSQRLTEGHDCCRARFIAEETPS